MDNREFQELFKSEAAEILRSLDNALVAYERDRTSVALLNELFRMAHTLKGMAATMDYQPIVRLAHSLENVLGMVRKSPACCDEECHQVLFEAADLLGYMVGLVGERPELLEDHESRHLDNLVGRLDRIASRQGLDNASGEPGINERRMLRLEDSDKEKILSARNEGVLTYSVKVVLHSDCPMPQARSFLVLSAFKNFGEILNEEYVHNQITREHFTKSFVFFLMAREDATAICDEISAIHGVLGVECEEVSPEIKSQQLGFPKSQQLGSSQLTSIRVPVGKIDSIFNLVGEMMVNRQQMETSLKSLKLPEIDDRFSVTRYLLNELQREVLGARLIPLSVVCNQFPRMVRDLAVSCGKEIRLEISGTDLGIDRTVLDEIRDPLVHLLRNCADHGIEEPDRRQQLGKPPQGVIRVQARKEEDLIVIDVSDDGNGIDVVRVREKALKLGIIDAQQASSLSDRESLMLITAPGLSTAERVTQTSGRGVGMDLVRKRIESFGGLFSIESQPRRGTKFTMKLPVSVAVLKALMVKVAGQIYAVPVINVLKIVYVPSQTIRDSGPECCIIDGGRRVPLVFLRTFFGLEGDHSASPALSTPVVLVRNNERVLGLVVDALVDHQELVVKKLDECLKRLRGVGGAAILGTGQVALIVDVPAVSP